MKSVSHCTHGSGSIIAEAFDEKDVKRQVYLSDVRSACVFPTGALPGYWLVFGRQRKQLPAGKYPLLFMAEGENIMHERLFEKLTDACSKYKCRTVYAYLPRADRKGGVGGFDDLWRYLHNRKLNINLIPAPAAEDVDYGKALAREFWEDGALDLPEMDSAPTILRAQLKQLSGIKERGRDVGTGDEDLYAFHALRHLLAGYMKFNNVIPYAARGQKSPKADPRGWT